MHGTTATVERGLERGLATFEGLERTTSVSDCALSRGKGFVCGRKRGNAGTGSVSVGEQRVDLGG